MVEMSPPRHTDATRIILLLCADISGRRASASLLRCLDVQSTWDMGITESAGSWMAIAYDPFLPRPDNMQAGILT